MQQISSLVEPFLRVLVWLYEILGNNLGFAIIGFTLLFRLILLPLSLPALRSQKKMRTIQPQLKRLKAEFGSDKQRLQQEQLKLYKEHNINPLAGCLPYLLQFAILIALHNALNTMLHSSELFGVAIRTNFFGLDLVKPDPVYVLPILSAVTQLVLSVMLLPGLEHHDVVPDKPKSMELKKEAKKEEDIQEMAEAMQKQMMFVMPIMTGVVALSFPSGLAIYWIASTLFSIIQQYFVSGWGGLLYYSRLVVSKLGGPVKAESITVRPVVEVSVVDAKTSELARALKKKNKFARSGGKKKKLRT